MGEQSEWIEWAGGECPVEAYETVEVRRRSGTVHKGRAYGFFWRHVTVAPAQDIIAYRVVTP